VSLTAATQSPVRQHLQGVLLHRYGWILLPGLLVLCLLPRMIMAWTIPGICPDAVLYIGLGKALEIGRLQEAAGQIHFNIYPLVLWYLHRLGLSWETAGMAWGVVISSCTVLPLHGWARRAFGQRVAVAASILYAIHPGLIRWSVEIIRDSTFWFLLTLSLYLLWRAITELRWTWHLAAGAAMALACLTRFEGLVLYVPLLAWSCWRAREDHASLRPLIAAGLVCASVYPLSLVLINATWFHGHTTDLVRTEPIALAQDWAQESFAGQRTAEKRARADLLPPLTSWKMVSRFATGLIKGFTPLYLLAIAGGIAASRRMVWRSDYRAMVYASGAIFAAIWIHLYWSHEAGPRYFYPIVIMSVPLAGWGLLQISSAIARRVCQRHAPATALLAAAVPLATILAVNLAVAWGGDNRSRAEAVELGRWAHERYGSVTLLGPDGVTQVVNHYAQGRCESFPETASAAEVVRRIDRLQPDVVLLNADRRGTSDELFACVLAHGFTPMDRSPLPGSRERLQVLVRSQGNWQRVSGCGCCAVRPRTMSDAIEGEKPRS
jgi:hypothetical protein